MVYSIDVFRNLIKQYGNWRDLSKFLQSQEGGLLRIIHRESEPYAIVRYVKGHSDILSAEKPWVRWMRSVVWNTESNRPVCVAPPKALTTDIPLNQSLEVEEFLEGVMVNGFLTADSKMNWTTRSTLTANTGFYGTKTFADMVADAQARRDVDISSCLKGTEFSFASFVLQHPEHRVVQKVEIPRLSLIHLGSVDESGMVTFADTFPESLHSWSVPKYPSLAQGETPERRLDTMIRTTEPTWQGLVFRGSCGDRWRIRSLSYRILRDLRGKESKIEDRFSRIRAQSMVRTYTQNWPEEQQIFMELEGRLRGLTSMIYTEYCAVHKEKSKMFLDVPIPLRSSVYHLHGIYLKNLRPQNLTLRMPIVIQYINNMPAEIQGALLRSSVEVDTMQGFQ